MGIPARIEGAMQTLSEPYPQRVMVEDEYSVSAIRQEVRELARVVGLGRTQQAKITAATSMIAKGLVINHWTGMFTIQPAHQGLRSGIEVSCLPPEGEGQAGELGLIEALSLGEARLLVDEARLTYPAGRPQVTLRIWLS